MNETLEYKISYRRHLPHFQPPGVMLFVTFRLAGSIPRQIQQELMAEAERVEARLARITDLRQRAEQARLERHRLFGRWDAALDMAKDGPDWLGRPEVAALVAESLHSRDGQVYDLDTFCIMPNHVHVVFTPLRREDETYEALPAIMQGLKGSTAYQANLLLGRRGSFWQHESYDHGVRDEGERRRIIAYVLNNPVKAGLVQHWQDWPWSYSKYPPE